MRFKNTMTHLEKTQRETYSQVHHIECQVATIPLWFLLSFCLLAKRQCWLLPSPKRNTHLGGSGLVVYQRVCRAEGRFLTERQFSVFRLATVHLHCLAHVGVMLRDWPHYSLWHLCALCLVFFKECFKVCYSFSICLSRFGWHWGYSRKYISIYALEELRVWSCADRGSYKPGSQFHKPSSIQRTKLRMTPSPSEL